MGKIILNWVVFIVAIAAVWFIWKYIKLPVLPTLSGAQVCLFGFALAFTWVEKLRIGSVKPFSCVGCMSGWLTLILAFMFHVEVWYFYLPVGLLIGSIYSMVKMRYL